MMLERATIAITGDEAAAFLQGIISQDVLNMPQGSLRYGCLLTPQGKFLHDFFIVRTDDGFWLTPEAGRAEALVKKLTMFKLRRAVTITLLADKALHYLNEATASSQPDPRHPDLGHLAFGDAPHADAGYDQRRIQHAIADGSRDMPPEQAILLEYNIDQAKGIDWDKGCYMGQELTARTKYRALLKKQLVPVAIDGAAPAFDAPLYHEDKEYGRMRSHNGNIGLALIKHDAINSALPLYAENKAKLIIKTNA